MAFTILKDRCVGCGGCAFVCKFGAINKVEDKLFEINSEKCMSCGQCSTVCINDAIKPQDDYKPIVSVKIDEEKCIGCSLCSRVCPAGACSPVIEKSHRKDADSWKQEYQKPVVNVRPPYHIDQSKCIKCGYCATKCRKDAIIVTY